MKTKRLFFLARAAMTLLLAVLTAATAWADAVNLSVDTDIDEGTAGHYYVNMPAKGTNTLTLSDATVTTFKVYDDGGKGGSENTSNVSGNYSNDCNGTLTLTAPAGYVLHISGSITSDGANDKLKIYDGNTTSATEIYNDWLTSKIRNPKVTSSGNSITLHFYSDATVNYAGLDLTVTIGYAINGLGSVTNGSATIGYISAKVGEDEDATTANVSDVVTLKAIPADDYLLSGISVTDANSNAVAVEWNVWTNTATFTMPNSPVTINPTFTNDLTNLSVNMPKTGTKTATIPAEVLSFKVYDDGGPGGAITTYSSGNYGDGCNGYLTLNAPAGCVLQLSGKLMTRKDDYLTVYDGEVSDDKKLLDKVDAKDSEITITTVVSTSNSITLYFYSDLGTNAAGLDLTVTLIDPNREYDINGIGNVTNGSIAASVSGTDVNKAKENDVITLTATPSAGYTLIDLSVKDANNNAVSVDRDVWSNTATFTMPASAVTVTPTFSNELSINMPATGTKTFAIPEGVQSFKVYDDGGKGGSETSSNVSGNYSNNCRGYLVLTAPTGYVLQLSGSITTEKYDKLTVYDNNEASGTKLLDAVSSTSSGVQTAITTVTSTGQSMTLDFYSDSNVNRAGLDLTVTIIKTLELANDADNTTAINNNNGMMSKVTLSDRTLLKNGDWNTLCLPFSLTAEQIAASPLAGATIKELLSTSSNLDCEGKLTLNFQDATAITAGKPYMVKWDNTPALTISSAADWETFASNVNGGTESYEGKVVKLSADISVSTMVGTVTSGNAPENAFKGIFDGGGHTITVDINSTDRHATAPFRYIKDATIMNVKTTGTVTGTMHCAGLVGFSEGTSYIKNCEVSVAVNCSGSSHSHCGGILGHGKSSTTTVSDCLFSGSISNATTAAGIIYGWGDNSTHTIVNCLAAGTYTGCSGVDLLKKDKGTEVITNCYKTENVGSQGTYTTATGDALVTLLGDGWVNNGGSVVPKMGVGYVPANLTNPVFKNVTIDNSAEAQAKMTVTSTDGKVKFVGTYSPFATTDGLLFDAHNTANGSFHAALSTPASDGYSVCWYTDAGKTTEATSIPFEADGSATLYVKWLKPFSYIDENGVEQTHTATIIDGSETNLPGGWYVVNNDVALTTKLNFTGDTHLILADGKTLSIDASGDSDPNNFYLGLSCRDGSTSYELTIYGQTAGTGKVTSKHGHPGYGSACGYNAKTITINGGVVEATSSGRGIWGSNVIINGGQIILAPSYANITADNITLGWRKPSDYIQAYDFVNPSGAGTITITDGKVFTDGTNVYDNTTTTSTLEHLSNVTLRPCLVLADNASNADAIAAYKGKTIAVALDGRTLTKDGKWNTLCLPFDIADPAAVFGTGVKVKTLSGYTNNGTTVTVTFTDAATIEAGTPYIIMLPNNAVDMENPVFTGVTIDNTMHDVTAGDATFKGTYSPVALTANDKKKLFLADNMLWYPNAAVTVRACRAYFELVADVPELSNGAPSIVVDFGDGNSTGVALLLSPEGDENGASTRGGLEGASWFTLDGRKLSQRPIAKGLYIINGKKVVVK